MSNDDLPPLPDPSHGFYAAPMYTADQMQRYAADALTAQAAEIERLRAAALGHETNCVTKAREIEALKAEVARLKADLFWLDRWMGHKSLLECADKVRAAIASGKAVTP